VAAETHARTARIAENPQRLLKVLSFRGYSRRIEVFVSARRARSVARFGDDDANDRAMSDGTADSGMQAPRPSGSEPGDLEMARARMHLLGEITGGVAHDFNNLLTVILASVENAKAFLPDDSPGRADLAAARDASLRGARLVRRLAQTSRSREPLAVQPNELLREATDLLRRTLPTRVQLRLEPGTDAWAVVADPIELWQIVFHAVAHARDAMPEGGVVTIAARNEHRAGDVAAALGLPAPGNYLVLRFEHAGPGNFAAAAEGSGSEPFVRAVAPAAPQASRALALMTRVARSLRGAVRSEVRGAGAGAVEVLLPRGQ
jgi:signal transduction histidine kinase